MVKTEFMMLSERIYRRFRVSIDSGYYKANYVYAPSSQSEKYVVFR